MVQPLLFCRILPPLVQRLNTAETMKSLNVTFVTFPSGDTFKVCHNETFGTPNYRPSCELCCFYHRNFGCFNPNIDECLATPYIYYVPFSAPNFVESFLNLRNALSTQLAAKGGDK